MSKLGLYRVVVPDTAFVEDGARRAAETVYSNLFWLILHLAHKDTVDAGIAVCPAAVVAERRGKDIFAVAFAEGAYLFQHGKILT